MERLRPGWDAVHSKKILDLNYGPLEYVLIGKNSLLSLVYNLKLLTHGVCLPISFIPLKSSLKFFNSVQVKDKE